MTHRDVLPEEDPKPEGHKPDLSWLVVAVDGAGDGWIMDKASGFDEVDLLPNGNSCYENGVYMPKGLVMGLYRVTEVKVRGGELVQSPNGDDYTDTEISGTWLRADKDAEPTPEDLYVVFDGPPGHESGRFVEVHDKDGRGVGCDSFGWGQEDGYHTLGPFYRRPQSAAGSEGGKLLVQWAEVLESDEVRELTAGNPALFNCGSMARDLRRVAAGWPPGCNWRGMGSAPQEESAVFLLDRGKGYTRAVPCFRRLKQSDEDGNCADGGGWTILEGCPDEGGFGCANTYVPDSLVGDDWRWSPMPETGR